MSAPDAAQTLERLKRLGVTISIDDFGTGHTSLGQLRDLPVDELKIDRSFTRTLTRGEGKESSAQPSSWPGRWTSRSWRKESRRRRPGVSSAAWDATARRAS